MSDLSVKAKAKGLQGQYQSNVFFKLSVVQAHVQAFFGYVQGRRAEGCKLSDIALAKAFIEAWGLDIDHISLSQRYTNYLLLMKELKKDFAK
jgi:hypothetical protein